MTKKIKNNTQDEHTWGGKVFTANEVYAIPSSKESQYSSDSQLLADITAGNAIVMNGDEEISNVSRAIDILKGFAQDLDITGRPIVRYAATVKGWHYQAHSIQFEVNKLNSIYNKNADGNDLGFCDLKIYKANGSECTTQGSADIDGVKTVLTWSPDFDFEIISGNIRQLDREKEDSYIHVRAKIATGLSAPNDWFIVPFTQGGINLRYIGADETLKTDGRASKLITGSNGDHFEIICNYDADLLTNDNRHKMSVIFEIYKEPTS
jgi:hypothetical protein